MRDLAHANEIKQALEAKSVVLTVKAGESGKLFGSVTTADIADAVKTAGGVVLEKRSIELAKPIKTIGKHTAKVAVHEGVVATVNLEVVAG